MIDWKNTQEEFWEGIFYSTRFCDDGGNHTLFVCIENEEDADYAERCVEACNALSEEAVSAVCMGIIRCAGDGGEEDFALPKLQDIQEILEYCWFTTLYPLPPKEDGHIVYAMEGEGEWGETVSFVMDNGRPVYVGTDFQEYVG